MRPITQQLSHDMTLLHLKEPCYRTDRLTGVFAVPLTAATAAAAPAYRAILPHFCHPVPPPTSGIGGSASGALFDNAEAEALVAAAGEELFPKTPKDCNVE